MADKNNITEAIKKIKQKRSESIIADALGDYFQEVEAEARETVTQNGVAVFAEVVNSAMTNMGGSFSTDKLEAAIIQSLTDVAAKNDDLVVRSEKTAAAIKEFSNAVKKLSERTYFDQKAFNQAMENAVRQINVALTIPDEYPALVEYARNADGKISTVTESYDGYSLVHSWFWRNGNLVKVKTERVES